MSYVALVTLLLLIQYMYFTFQAGMARGKDIVVAPATTGDEMYERKSRVQINTLEQLAVTLPGMWICAHYFRPDVAALLGAIFFCSRFVFSALYIKDPKSRAPGFIPGFFANVGLVLCAAFGVISQLI